MQKETGYSKTKLTLPFADGPDADIFLAIGPAMWLRLIPKIAPDGNWSPADLFKCATRGGSIFLQPLRWANLHYLQADDGFGTYAFSTYRDSSTTSVAFAFEAGEVWSVDTYLLVDSQNSIYFLDIARHFIAGLQNYGVFLQSLGLEPPFDWIAGLEGVKGWRLQVPPPPNHISLFLGNTCLTAVVTLSSSRGSSITVD